MILLKNTTLCLVLEIFDVMIMSGMIELVGGDAGGTCRRAVITGLSRAPEWSELCDKLTFLRYMKVKATEEKTYVVYAHAHPPLRARQPG